MPRRPNLRQRLKATYHRQPDRALFGTATHYETLLSRLMLIPITHETTLPFLITALNSDGFATAKLPMANVSDENGYFEPDSA